MLSFCKGIKTGQLFLTAEFNQILLTFNECPEEKAHFSLHTASVGEEELKDEAKMGSQWLDQPRGEIKVY